MAQQMKIDCRGCQRPIALRVIGKDASGKDQWRPYETDAAGTPIREHKCAAYAAGVKAGTIPAPASSTPTGTPTPTPGQRAGTPAPAVNGTAPGQTSYADADAEPVLAFDADAIYAELDAEDKLAEAMVNHADVVRVYTDSETASARRDADGSTRPAIDPDYMIDETDLSIIRALITDANGTGTPQNIGLYGPKGTGKSSLGAQIAALDSRPLFIVEAADKESPTDWYTTTSGLNEDGTIDVRPSRFVVGIETPNAVVVINDLALLQSPSVQSGLNELLDPTSRETFVEALNRMVRVAPGVIIVATYNVGAEYNAARELSAQLTDRLAAGALFEVPYPSGDVLAAIVAARSGLNAIDSAVLVAVAERLRADADPIEVSTRELISAARKMVLGIRPGVALAKCVLGQLDPNSQARAFGIVDVAIAEAGVNNTDRRAWLAPKRSLVSIARGIQ